MQSVTSLCNSIESSWDVKSHMVVFCPFHLELLVHHINILIVLVSFFYFCLSLYTSVNLSLPLWINTILIEKPSLLPNIYVCLSVKGPCNCLIFFVHVIKILILTTWKKRKCYKKTWPKLHYFWIIYYTN